LIQVGPGCKETLLQVLFHLLQLIRNSLSTTGERFLEVHQDLFYERLLVLRTEEFILGYLLQYSVPVIFLSVH
jgi:hypothetical protein